MDKPVCISTKERITNQTGTVRFLCPNCGQHEIIRTQRAKKIVAKYTCPKCGFSGPN